MEKEMNLKKYSDQKSNNNALENNCTFIEINHYENDKLLKTETYPLSHFLEGFENEFKRVRYN
tara:strand:+ start:254 stop:442 length:189 start_codon:yes stop_codon:yes gene_type:complete